ncbi:MAG TPA: plastocyanin/azurin family copper-binding protein [Acidimicrobiales bacterium]|nr:plastocyanin/azurin family copper-binding protein [Acidimicrobiales bacterium]
MSSLPVGRVVGPVVARPVARAVVAAVAVASVLGGCSSTKKPAAVPPAGVQAEIKVFAFLPNPLKVAKGVTVTWTNQDDITHTVTSGKRDYAPGDTGKVTAEHRDGLFDFTLDGKGKAAKFTFTNAGTFHYFCSRHPGMEADVVVQ